MLQLASDVATTTLVFLVLVLAIIFASPVTAAPSGPTSTGQTFFFSPGAPSTNSSCTDTAPCPLSLLPGKAIPGAQMILKNGTYSGSGTVLALDSTRNTVNGTSTSPITVRAQNPGRALIIGNGTTGHVVRLRVDWWILEDLRIENVNNSAYRGSEAGPLRCTLCNHVVIRGNIVRNPNAWGNNAAVSITGTNNLIEDNDILRFHRNGLALFGAGTKNNVVRGNYVGQTVDRLYSSPGAPNDGFVAYDAPNNIWENNIFEQTGSPGGSTATEGFVAWAGGNKYYGNISIGATNNGMVLVSKGSTSVGATNYLVRDQISIGMRQIGLYLRSPVNADVRGFTAHSTSNRGLVLNNSDSVPATSAIVRNMMLIVQRAQVPRQSIASLCPTRTNGGCRVFGARGQPGKPVRRPLPATPIRISALAAYSFPTAVPTNAPDTMVRTWERPYCTRM